MIAKNRKKNISKATPRDQALIVLNIFDGSRTRFLRSPRLLVRISDGAQYRCIEKYFSSSSISLKVPFSDNFKDNYTVLVSSEGFRDVGYFPVKVSWEEPTNIDLMLVSRKTQYKFLSWNDFKIKYKRFADFLNCENNDKQTGDRYEKLRKDKPAALASLLNLTTAMSNIHLRNLTPLEYFKRIDWDESLSQDRFFGFVDANLVDQIRASAADRQFAPEPSPGLFHGGATSSFKQVEFGEGNVQLTFHEKTMETIRGVKCIRVEPDIDDYKDLAAHALLEVIPNTLTNGKTDPKAVYILRWIAGRRNRVPEFDPGYVLI